MNYNPKVVPFNRSAAYVHHRAMKNRRDNNPVEALELMRSAVEHSPENREYKLDLAEMYCDMGCHTQSCRILLDMLAEKDAPAECYYGLALNRLALNEAAGAKRALFLYEKLADNDEYIEESKGLRAEIDLYNAMIRPFNRKIGRAQQIAAKGCEALREDAPERAVRLFERSLQMNPDQSEMRALYAVALHLSGDRENAFRQAEMSVSENDPGVRALCTAAQVFHMCGRDEAAKELLTKAIEEHPAEVELRLLTFSLGELGMHAEASDAVRLALQETPHDRELLHMRAVSLHKSGAEDAKAEAFWHRILRIDPDDTVAQFYQEAAAKGMLEWNEPQYPYEVTDDEYKSRLQWISDALGKGMESAAAEWKKNRKFRSILSWAAGTGTESCCRAAMMIIASVDDPEAESVLRELLYRGSVPVSAKLNAMLFYRMRGGDGSRIAPPDMDPVDGILPEADELLPGMPVGERQLIRYANDVLEQDYGISALPALALMWQAYRASAKDFLDPLVRTQEASAALTWNYLLRHKKHVPVKKLAKQFGCNPRRMIYYAQRIASVMDTYEGKDEDEDH